MEKTIKIEGVTINNEMLMVLKELQDHNSGIFCELINHLTAAKDYIIKLDSEYEELPSREFKMLIYTFSNIRKYLKLFSQPHPS